MGLHTETITGRTGLLGILADPTAPVRTPELVNAALAERGLYGKYLMVPFEVTATHLPTCLEGLRNTGNFRGAVVTAPHKRAILELLDHVSVEAEQVGACNVINRDARGYLSGSICDGEGFVRGLHETGYGLSGSRCLLVGTGGAGTGIAFALARADVESLHILSRTPAKALELAGRVKQAYPNAAISTGLAQVAEFDIIINVTSLGLNPNDPLPLDIDDLGEHTIVADIVIGTEPTPLLRRALALGCPTYSGHEMLAAQIELMIDYMTGEKPYIARSTRAAAGHDTVV
jgi:shikimate dehydrogenase